MFYINTDRRRSIKKDCMIDPCAVSTAASTENGIWEALMSSTVRCILTPVFWDDILQLTKAAAIRTALMSAANINCRESERFSQ